MTDTLTKQERLDRAHEREKRSRRLRGQIEFQLTPRTTRRKGDIFAGSLYLVVNNFNIAKRIFQDAFGFSVLREDEGIITFDLNGETELQCWLPKEGTGAFGRWVHLYAPTEKLFAVHQKLKATPETYTTDLKTLKWKDGKETHLLQIVTPKWLTTIIVSDNFS